MTFINKIKQCFKKYSNSKHSQKNLKQINERCKKQCMLTLRSEHDEFQDDKKVIKTGETYAATVSRGFIHPDEHAQFVRRPNMYEDAGKLVIFIDIVDGGKLLTTFCYNSLEFNENWTIIR